MTESKTKTKESETASSRGPTEQTSLRYDQRPVSERLITMGQMYEAKKALMREQAEYVKKASESSLQTKLP